MKGRLVYVVGPSGAGKDSVLEYARTHLPADSGVIFARRFITRPPSPNGEQHIPVSTAIYDSILLKGGFSLSWSANGTRYGIGREIQTWMSLGLHVVVNGSREYLQTAACYYPGLLVVHIAAPLEVIEKRLANRGRENSQEIADRLKRAVTLTLPEIHNAYNIINDQNLEVAGDELTSYLLSLHSTATA